MSMWTVRAVGQILRSDSENNIPITNSFGSGAPDCGFLHNPIVLGNSAQSFCQLMSTFVKTRLDTHTLQENSQISLFS